MCFRHRTVAKGDQTISLARSSVQQEPSSFSSLPSVLPVFLSVIPGASQPATNSLVILSSRAGDLGVPQMAGMGGNTSVEYTGNKYQGDPFLCTLPTSALELFRPLSILLFPLAHSLCPFLGDGVKRGVSSSKQAVLSSFQWFCWKRFDRRSKVLRLFMTFILLSVLLQSGIRLLINSAQTKWLSSCS